MAAYPVGSIYISFNSTSPATLFGGTWAQLTGAFLRADTNTNTGGSDTMNFVGCGANYGLTASSPGYGGKIVLTSNQHGANASFSMENRPKFQNVYMWRRTK